MASKADDYARQVADALIAQLKAGTAPWQKPWAAGDAVSFLPHNPVTGKPYRGGNAIWLMCVAEMKGYADTRWMTYRQAEGIDAQVRGGEKASPIEYWQWEDEVPVTDAHGRPVRDGAGKVLLQKVELERPRRFEARVFNAAQIDGLPPLPARPEASWDRHERAEALLRASGAAIRHVGGDRAYYDSLQDRITLPEAGQFASADRYYQTALHELGHWTGHPTRLARDLAHPYGSTEYAREELRAEIASLMVGAELGIGHDPGRCAAYVQSWIKALQEDPREIIRAAGDAQTARAFILDFELERKLEHEERALVVPVFREEGAAPVGEERATMADEQRRYLVVPFAEKDELKRIAKEAGTWARWDKSARAWYVPASADPAPFERWVSRATATRPEPAAEFAAALEAAGLRLAEPAVMDGVLHRVPVEGDGPSEKSGAYKGHLDGRPAGFIENFKTGFRGAWKASGPVERILPEDLARLREEATARKADREQARAAAALRAVKVVRRCWEAAHELAGDAPHPYLVRKGIPALGGIRVDDKGALLVPVVDGNGDFQSLQWIAADGTKRFKKHGRVPGGHFVLNPTPAACAVAEGRPPVVLVAEGYATGVTLARATEQTVVVAFNAGNLEAVARSIRERLPAAVLFIAGDNDEAAEKKQRPNVGREKALAAAAAAGGTVLLPVFDGAAGSDWNDLERARGQEHVREALRAGLELAQREHGHRALALATAAERRPELAKERDGLAL